MRWQSHKDVPRTWWLTSMLAIGAIFALSACHASKALLLTEVVEAAIGLRGSWSLDDAKGNQALDASNNGGIAYLQNAPAWTAGKIGSAVQFDGVTQALLTKKSVLDTSRSFSVSAWIQLDSVTQTSTAVSQDGDHVSMFRLQYVGSGNGADAGRFAFTLMGADSSTAAVTRVTSPFSALAGVWYHLAGVYDSATGAANLYVNGVQVASRPVSAAWNATGPLAIGRGRFGGIATDYFAGRVDEVRAYAENLSQQDVADLYHVAPATSPLRPPAVPLIVRSPYVSTWQASDASPGAWPTFWTGATRAIGGLVRVDGVSYAIIGDPGRNVAGVRLAQQTQLELTSTQSRYAFAAGPVDVNVNFLSPVEANDLQRLSAPLGYIYVQAQSVDGATHAVQVYLDISGEWADGDTSQPITWQFGAAGATQAWSVQPANPRVLQESNDAADWGAAIFASSGPGMTYQNGEDANVRAQMVAHGTLLNSVDPNMPRAISANWPVFAFSYDLGALGGVASAPIVFALGHVRLPAVSYLAQNVNGLWQSYWASWQSMVSDMYTDAYSLAALNRANGLDAKLNEAGVAAGGPHYAALLALALRQTMGGTELVGPVSDPWLFLKEISSDGNLSTVDVIYPSMPGLLWINPTLVKLILNPILTYAESGNWPEVYAPHDLGISYPNATGHNDGGGENMPVEESANMLLMSAAYLKSAPNDLAFSHSHYPVLRQWTEYLVSNALDPNLQNQTDDFTGFIAHSSNLALKGILGIGAMSQIASLNGNTTDAQRYSAIAKSYIGQWVTMSQDSSGKHLKLAYNQDGTWSLKYNAFMDRLLELNLIPTEVLQREATWYLSQSASFGFPLDNRHGYTKADWEMWIAASTDDPNLRQQIIDKAYAYINQTQNRVPFSDWYETSNGVCDAFKARPVVGGMFSILDRLQTAH